MTQSQDRSTVVPTGSRRPILRVLSKAVHNWMERHQHPFNFAIHLIGIPVAVAAIPVFFLLPWYWGVAALFIGYALQFVGHAVEGNDVGEWAAIKRMLGLPYVGIAPRWQQREANSTAATHG